MTRLGLMVFDYRSKDTRLMICKLEGDSSSPKNACLLRRAIVLLSALFDVLSTVTPRFHIVEATHHLVVEVLVSKAAIGTSAAKANFVR